MNKVLILRELRSNYINNLLVVIIAGWILVNCATPAKRYNNFAKEHKFISQRIKGTHYHHTTFRNFSKNSALDLHVYLDSDGTPWKYENQVALDPTPRNHLVLQLMSHDSVPSILLGRPCYHGDSLVPPCNALLWTFGRYSEPVIKSMETVLRKNIKKLGTVRLTFIGYSGGGVIAMLLASRFRETINVITIAANLDSDAWAAYHSFTPLYDSLNPSLSAVLDSRIQQSHLVGGKDLNVPFSVVKDELHRQGAHYTIYPMFDHKCCWQNIWKEFLENFQSTRLKIKKIERNTLNYAKG